MGSLESSGLPLKRDSLLRSASANNRRPRSRFSRFLLFKKLDYLQWICTVAVFLFFVVLFQMFLPGSLVDNKSQDSSGDYLSGDLEYLNNSGELDFGDDISIEPQKLLKKFQREDTEIDFSASFNRMMQRFGYRKPQIALVFADLSVDPQQLLMVTVAIALRDIGYELQVYSVEDGPTCEAWRNIGVPVTVTQINQKTEIYIDWLIYDGILVSSLKAKEVFSGLLREPFKNIPVIWTIHEDTLVNRSREYILRGQVDLVKEWKKVYKDDLRAKIGYGVDEFVIALFKDDLKNCGSFSCE